MPRPTAVTIPSDYDKEAVSHEPVVRQPEALTEPEPAELGTGTYYMDPKDMSAAQLVKFQHRAKFEHMTVKDYERWLLTFDYDDNRLTEFHRANLKILHRGGRLAREDIPKATPKTSFESYQSLQDGTK